VNSFATPIFVGEVIPLRPAGTCLSAETLLAAGTGVPALQTTVMTENPGKLIETAVRLGGAAGVARIDEDIHHGKDGTHGGARQGFEAAAEWHRLGKGGSLK